MCGFVVSMFKFCFRFFLYSFIGQGSFRFRVFRGQFRTGWGGMVLSGWFFRFCIVGGGLDQEGFSGLGLGVEVRVIKVGGVGLLFGNSIGINFFFLEGGVFKGGCTIGRQYFFEGILFVRLVVWGGRVVYLNVGVLIRYILVFLVSEVGDIFSQCRESWRFGLVQVFRIVFYSFCFLLRGLCQDICFWFQVFIIDYIKFLVFVDMCGLIQSFEDRLGFCVVFLLRGLVNVIFFGRKMYFFFGM